MQFTKLNLENYRCFESETVTFEQGVTVIHGLNGTGKSTLLEACFFALYGADALDTGETLEDVMTTGKEETSVRLQFWHDDQEYEIYRQLKVRGDRPSQTTCEFETPDGLITGVTAVDKAVKQLIRLDATAFLSSAYVRQGEIEQLIQADASTRQELIDNLLQLSDLETYRDRVNRLRIGIKRVRKNVANLIDDRQNSIENIHSDDPYEEVDQLENKLDQLETERATLQDKQDDLEQRKEELSDEINTLESTEEQIETVEQKIDKARESLQKIEETRTEEHNDLKAKQDEVDRLKVDRQQVLEEAEVDVDVDPHAGKDQLVDHRDDLRSTKENLHTEINEAQTKRRNKVSKIQDIRTQIEERETLINNKQSSLQGAEEELEDEIRPELDKIKQEHNSKTDEREAIEQKIESLSEPPSEERLSELESQKEDLTEEKNALAADRQTITNEIEQAQRLKDQGKCPECGQDVEGAPHVEQLPQLKSQKETLSTQIAEVEEKIDETEEQIEVVNKAIELDQERESIEQTLSHLESRISDKKAAVADRESTIDEYRNEINQAQEEIETLREEIGELNASISTLADEISSKQDEKETVQAKLDAVDELITLLQKEETLRQEIATKNERVSQLEERIEEHHSRISDLADEKETLEDTFDPDRLASAREEYQQVTDQIDTLKHDIEAKTNEMQSIQQEIGEVKSKIEQLESLVEERDRLERDHEAVGELYNQMEAIEGMYDQLRTDLRQDNVAHLETLLNDLFDLLYRNDAYSEITLSENYEISVIEKGEQKLGPEKLSGGEKAIFNISLRCAIYQLLVEGFGNAAAMPPLIFDEPTVHLDDGHVDQLNTIVQRMKEVGVDQLIVVSHNEEVIGSANHKIRVEQEQTSNRSTAVEESLALI